MVETKAAPMPAPGWSDLLSGRNAIYSLALAGGVVLHAVNLYIAATVLPSVVKDIGGLDYYAWSTTLFVVASILGSALSAKLLQGAGARGAYVAAALVFAAGTLICASAPNMATLLLGRFVQGFGGGLLYALAYAVIRLVLPEPLWARAIGLISAMWGIATLVGPAIGGIFAELDSWRAAFWSLLPCVVLFAAMAFAVLPARGAEQRARTTLPLLQLALLTTAVLVLSAASVTSEPTWSIAGMAIGIVLLGLLVVAEGRARTPLLPKGALDLRAPLGPLYATIALLMIGIQPELFVPYFLQVLHARSPLIAGYLAAVLSVGWTIGSMLSSGLGARSARRVIVAGPMLVLLGSVALAALLPIATAGDWVVLGPVSAALLLIGLGIGLAWPHIVTRVFQLAPPSQQDLAASAISTVQLFAAAIGAAAAGLLANLAGLAEPGGAVGAASAARWLFVAFALAPVLALWTATRIARAAVQAPSAETPRAGEQSERPARRL